MAKEEAIYSHGHHQSVVRSHARRTAQSSAAFLLPHLWPSDSILDIGCGPGTITVDLAKIVKDGKVTAIDTSSNIIEQARQYATSQGVNNVQFQVADGNELPFSEATFDVIFVHQVLQHVKNPVALLKEMYRVVKPGGIVAVREADYASFVWYPEAEGLTQWSDLYQKVARANGGDPNAGRVLHAWARQAGFKPKDVRCSYTAWCYATKEETQQFAHSWSERVLHSFFADSALSRGFATKEDLEFISQSWKQWPEDEDAWMVVPSAEILCRKT